MKGKAMLRFWPLLLLLMPSAALAVDMEYLTYNAFEETVAGFQRLALFTSDPLFVMLTGCFVAGSVVIGTLMFAGQAHAGQANNPLALFFPLAIGLALFFGAVVPKGRVFIYDPVRNKNQAVGGVPDLIVFIAGTLSAIEREVTRIVDTASANPYGDDAGALNYSLILNAGRAPINEVGLERTIARYYKDCGVTAIGSGHNGATLQELLRESDDLRDTFAKYSHPAWPTVWYPVGNDGGQVGTCADAWTYLRGKLDNAATMNPLKDTICTQAGFNMADGAQSARCDQQIVQAANLYGLAAASSAVFLRNYVIAAGITRLQSDPDFSAVQGSLVNRQMMAESFGSSQAMNQWVPKLRGFLVATVLGIAPLTLMFLATPLVYRSVALIMGLFVWLTLWGISDAMSVQMAQDAASDAFAQIKQYHIGYEAIMNSPDAAVQALGVFGKARTMALMLATVLSGALFKFGGYAFTGMAQTWQNELNSTGEKAGRDSMLPEDQSSMQQRMIDAPGAQARVSGPGYDNAAGAAAQPGMRSGYGYGAQREYIDQRLSGGGIQSMDSMNRDLGRTDSGHTVGGLEGTRAVGESKGLGLMDASRQVDSAQTQRGGVGALETRDAANHEFKDGLSGLAAFQAREGVAGSGAQRDLAKRFGGDGTGLPELDKLEQQTRNQTGAAIDASGADVNRDLASRTVRAREDLAGAEQLGAFKEGPERAGAAGSRSRMAGVIAQEGVEDRHGGMAGLVAGQTLQQERAAAAGVTAEHLGGAATAGATIGRQDLAHQLGGATARQKAAQFLGYGNKDSGLLAFEEAGASQISTVVQGEALNRVVDNLQDRGAITQQQGDMLRKKGAFGVSMGFDEAGNIANARFDGQFASFQGSTANVNDGVVRTRNDVDRTEFERSNTAVRRDTSVDDYSKRIAGAAAFTQDRGAIADQLERAFGGNMVNGAPDANSKNQIVGQFVESLGAAGYRLEASNAEQFQMGMKANADVGLGMPGVGGIGAGGNVSRSSSDDSGTRRDVANTYYREALDRSVETGRQEAASRFGDGWETGPHAAEGNRYIADVAASEMQSAHKSAIIQAEAQTSAANRQNDVVEDTADQRRRDQEMRHPPEPSMLDSIAGWFN